MSCDIEYLQNRSHAESKILPYEGLGKLLDHTTDFPGLLQRRIENRTETLQEGAIDIDVERVVKIVLGTGGPHTEIRWFSNGKASIVCYGWFGKDRYERDLTEYELDGLRMTHGEWEELAEGYARD